jgi:hypothetical protein
MVRLISSSGVSATVSTSCVCKADWMTSRCRSVISNFAVFPFGAGAMHPVGWRARSSARALACGVMTSIGPLLGKSP